MVRRAKRSRRRARRRRVPWKPRVRLVDIVPAEKLQKIQDGFVGAFDLPVLFADETGRPITQSVHLPQFCAAFASLPDEPDKASVCPRCQHEVDPARMSARALRKGRSGKAFVHGCPGGCVDYWVPIRYRGNAVGYCMMAQTPQMVDPVKYKALAGKLGVEPEKAFRAIHSVRILSTEKIKNAILLVQVVCEIVMELARASRRRIGKQS